MTIVRTHSQRDVDAAVGVNSPRRRKTSGQRHVAGCVHEECGRDQRDSGKGQTGIQYLYYWGRVERCRLRKDALGIFV